MKSIRKLFDHDNVGQLEVKEWKRTDHTTLIKRKQ